MTTLRERVRLDTQSSSWARPLDVFIFSVGGACCRCVFDFAVRVVRVGICVSRPEAVVSCVPLYVVLPFCGFCLPAERESQLTFPGYLGDNSCYMPLQAWLALKPHWALGSFPT